MHFNKKTVRDIDVEGKRVLLRCDLNVPMDKQTGEITDDLRIMASLPTIEYLLEHGASVICCSHMGRPKGEVKPELTLKPVAAKLSQLLDIPVEMIGDAVSAEAKEAASGIEPGQVMLLENLRFHKEETTNDPEFAATLASYGDIFVCDSFGTVHRAHASTVGVTEYLPSVCGLLVEKELMVMSRALRSPTRPFVAIMGGSKVSDKLDLIENLLDKADTLLIGGGMAYTFIKAAGGSIGKSLCEDDRLEYVQRMRAKAEEKGVKLLLPTDTLAAREFKEDAEYIPVKADAIGDDLMGLDIGEETIKAFVQEINSAGTVFWNGPMGVFEFENFAKGTKAVAYAMAECTADTIIGGGDSAAAVRQMGIADRFSHVSTGGGASLKMLEGKELPGVDCLLEVKTPYVEAL